ncbi:MAG: polysaccharide deacetylase family protein [Pyrinomonadaceae bacterium]
MKKRILKAAYKTGLFTPFHYFGNGGALVLMYHRFSNSERDGFVSEKEFAGHLRYLEKHCTVISLDELADAVRSGGGLPSNAVVITIDDGYRDAFEIAYPLLRSFGFAATMYVVTDFVDGRIWLWTDLMRYVLLNTVQKEIQVKIKECEVSAVLDSESKKIETAAKVNGLLKKMPDEERVLEIARLADSLSVTIPELPTEDFAPISWNEAREMDSNGLAIESHTVSHPILTRVSSDRLGVELQESRAKLETELGRRIRHFCYPNGSYDIAVRDAVPIGGYSTAVTTNYGFCGENSNIFEIKRIDAQPLIENFAQTVSGFETLRGRIGI